MEWIRMEAAGGWRVFLATGCVPFDGLDWRGLGLVVALTASGGRCEAAVGWMEKTVESSMW